MQPNLNFPASPWLVWVYSHRILSKFNATPRLEITKEMRNLGWKVDLIACGPRGEHLAQGVKVLLFPALDVYFLRHLIFHMLVIGYILRNWRRIDVVMFHQISALWMLPLRSLFVFGKKHPLFVMDTRTVTMEVADKATGREKRRKSFYSLMSNLANNFADGQTAITKPMADLLQMPKEKLWGTWPSGVNLEEFSSAAKNHAWPAEHDAVTIIYIGSMHYGRNLSALSRAIHEANREGMNFKLVLYGEGTEKKDLQAYANQSNGCIKVFDTVPHNQIPDILASAHVGALPFPDEDKYRVSSFIKLFEYMGAGMPVLATRIICHTDVIGDGRYAFWANDASVDGLLTAIRKIWQSRFELSSMGLQAFVAAKDWTYAASAKRLDKALHCGLSRHGTPATAIGEA